MSTKLNLDVRKGDTFSRQPTWRNKASQVGVNLTGATVSGSISKGTTTVPFTCSLIDAANGVFKFMLSAGTTAALELGTYSMELKVTFPDTTVKTLFTGNFVVYA